MLQFGGGYEHKVVGQGPTGATTPTGHRGSRPARPGPGRGPRGRHVGLPLLRQGAGPALGYGRGDGSVVNGAHIDQ